MSAQRITFDDKITTLPEVIHIEEIRAGDVNLFKSTINNHADLLDINGNRINTAYTNIFGNQNADLSALTTLAKTSIIGAINEVNSTKLGINATAQDSLKLGGQLPAFYSPQSTTYTKTESNNAITVAVNNAYNLLLNNADALVICTEWQNFKAPDFSLIKSLLTTPVIFDGRNLFEPKRLKNKGFSYYSIGRNIL